MSKRSWLVLLSFLVVTLAAGFAAGYLQLGRVASLAVLAPIVIAAVLFAIPRYLRKYKSAKDPVEPR